MKQYELEEKYQGETTIESSESVYREMRDIKDWDKEVFVAFYLNTKNAVISREVISIGTLNSSIIHPREIFRTAVVRNACAVVISHNHPSGSLEPSEEDKKATRKLKEAGDILGITLLDHVIVTRTGYFSFKAEELF